ncbi:hypothetical protein M9458_024548, partial [Cirrhinus mrigala]
ATDEAGNYICEESYYWDGWYRLLYNGMDIRMPESCVNAGGCNTDYSLMESTLLGCCYFESIPIRVKACPGNYYVYELLNPQYGCSGYCT